MNCGKHQLPFAPERMTPTFGRFLELLADRFIELRGLLHVSRSSIYADSDYYSDYQDAVLL